LDLFQTELFYDFSFAEIHVMSRDHQNDGIHCRTILKRLKRHRQERSIVKLYELFGRLPPHANTGSRRRNNGNRPAFVPGKFVCFRP